MMVVPKGSLMVILKRFLGVGAKKISPWWYQKGSLMMVLERFHDGGTKKHKNLFNKETFRHLQTCYHCYKITFKNKNA